MKTINYMGYEIQETSPAQLALGFRWRVNPSLTGARGPDEMPLFHQLPAAKAFIRESLLNERPFNDDVGGGSS